MYYMKHETTITSKGTVTIAASIRKALGLKAGQKIRMELDKKNNRILMETALTMEQVVRARDEMLSRLPKRKPLTGSALRKESGKAWLDGYNQ
jgi:AbrB family looped-hinge helix DNA binding protein